MEEQGGDGRKRMIEEIMKKQNMLEENAEEESRTSESENISEDDTQSTEKDADQKWGERKATGLRYPKVHAKRQKASAAGWHLPSFFAGAGAGLCICALVLALVFSLPAVFPASSPDSIGSIKKVRQIQSIIRANYLNDPDEQQQTDYMMLGIVAGLDDKYAAYYTKEEYQDILQSHEGQMKGVGITITADADSGEILIDAVQKDSPADRAGVKKDDILLKVNGTGVTGKTTSETAALISKSETDDISLEIRRDGKEMTFDMKKETLSLTSASGKMLDDKIGYIQITTFNNATPEQFRKAYDKLQDQGMKALVLDLRDNGGGLADSCVKIASSILPEGPVVYEEDRQGHEKHRDNKEDNMIQVPMTVLVNGNTASASEILSGAIRDYGAGILVGTTTYGKGIEQDTYKLYDGSRLKITTTHYYTPDHFDLNGKGLEPDIEVNGEEGEAEEDPVLEAALKYLEKHSA